MNIWCTQESSSFSKSMERLSTHQIINGIHNKEFDYFRRNITPNVFEIDMYDPSLKTLVQDAEINAIVHPLIHNTSGVVDVSIEIQSAVNLFNIAQELNIPVFLITSPYYGNKSETNYDIITQAIHDLVKINKFNVVTVKPPLIYGPDYNSGLSNIIKSVIGQESKKCKLDIDVKYPFMYDKDFFNNLDRIIENNYDYDSCIAIKKYDEILPREMFSIEDLINDETNHFDFDIEASISYDMYAGNAQESYPLLTGVKDMIQELI
jgi:hypothetical protein